MVGRGRKRRAAKTPEGADVPEAAELVRSEPDLLALIEGEVPGTADEDAERRSS
jgi:hypothetical protein